MSETNQRQVGGSHYRTQYQHWDFVEQMGLGYLEGCATKYVARNRRKHANPLIDLEKAFHFVEKARELFLTTGRGNRAVHPVPGLVNLFTNSYELTPEETRIINILTYWQDDSDLTEALDLIKELIVAAKQLPSAVTTVNIQTPEKEQDITEEEHF